MRSTAKTYLFLSIFFVCVATYFLVPLLYPQNHTIQQYFFKQFDVFNSSLANFILVVLLIAILSFCGMKLVEIFYVDIAGTSSKKPSLGKYLLDENLISEEELERALMEQRYRLGEMLIKGNRIKKASLEDALRMQKKTHQKIGKILCESGYTKEEDITWALEKMDRRLGEILKDNGCISEYDLQCILSYQQYHDMTK